jgi:hypothetical protein
MKILICFLLFGFGGSLAASSPELEVRVVTFEAPEPEWIGKAAQVPVGDASACFASLIAGVENGAVSLANDSMIRVRPGQKSKTEGIVEFAFPTEFEPDGARQSPASFESKSTGSTLECEATVQGEWIDLNLRPQTIRFRGWQQCPCVLEAGGVAQSGAIAQPIFLTEGCAAQVACRSGVPVLISQSRPADVWDERPGGTAQRTLLTFAIATLRGKPEAAPPVEKPVQARLHLAGVRMASADALSLLETVDAKGARFSLAQSLIAEGRAGFATGTAVICRLGQKSRVESSSEFPSPTKLIREKGWFPGSFEFKNLGDTLETSLTGDGNEVDFLHYLIGRPVLHRCAPRADTPGAAVELAEFRTLSLNHRLSLETGIWRQLSIIPCQDDERSFSGKGGSMVWFACLASAVPAGEVRPSSVYATAINLESDKAAAWKSRMDEGQLVTDLLQHANSGGRWSVAGALAGADGSGNVTSDVERLFPDTNKLQETMARHGMQWKEGTWTLAWPAAESTGPELSEVVKHWQLRDEIAESRFPKMVERTWTLAASGQTFIARFLPAQDQSPNNLRFYEAETYQPTPQAGMPPDPFANDGPAVRYQPKQLKLSELTAGDQQLIRDLLDKYARWKSEWDDPHQVKSWQAEVKLSPLPEADGKWHFAGWKETEGPDGKGTAAVLVRRE